VTICSKCGIELLSTGNCVNCRSEVSASPLAVPDRIVRPIKGRIIFGVCTGLARGARIKCWLIRILFICPGAFLLCGPILYVYISYITDEWPPSAPIIEGHYVDNYLISLNHSVQIAKKWTIIIVSMACILFVWLLLYLIFVVYGHFQTTALVLADLFPTPLMLLLLLTCFPVAFITALMWYQVSCTKDAEAKRIEKAKKADRICGMCQKRLTPGSISCPFCGCEELRAAT